MRSFLGRDILSLKDFERGDFERVFEVADELAPIARRRRNENLLEHKTLLTAFYQPSTRTRLATEAAMHRLGGRVLGFSDAKMTRAGDFYQESIKDTVHMLEYYGDVIAMRHFQQGAPAEAARWFRRAAERNSPAAAFNLATLLWRGQGVKKDAIEAYRWFATAGLYGDDAMINRVTGILLQLEEQMSEADLTKAQDSVPDWENRRYRPQATLETLAEP